MSNKDKANVNDIDIKKRRFLIATTTVLGVAATGTVIVPFVSSMMPSERAKAAGAPVEVDISKVAPGTLLTVEWRGKPVWIIHRDQPMLEKLSHHDDELSDPKLDILTQQPEYCRNATRSIKSNIMILVGICTHLGCSPTAKLQQSPEMGEHWDGGFFCPCHGSKFDLAGRVFKGSPAPINLIVPRHQYIQENLLVIGADAKGVA